MLLFAACSLSLVGNCLLCAASVLSVDGCCWLLNVRCSLCVAGCVLSVMCYVLFVDFSLKRCLFEVVRCCVPVVVDALCPLFVVCGSSVGARCALFVRC